MSSATRVILDPKRVSEHIFPVFDFLAKMAAGDTISTATITITVWSGVDANPSALWDATFFITPPSQVQPGIIGGLPGVIYLLQIAAGAGGSKTLVLEGLLAILPEGM
jgi:hypothetical protein